MENAETQKMNLAQFGELEISKINIFNFPNGIHGFENEKRFLVISDEKLAPVKWLISLDNPEIGFPIVSPWHLKMDYDMEKDIDLSEIVPMLVVETDKENNKTTANFKAPIFFNVKNQTGYQEIIEETTFSAGKE